MLDEDAYITVGSNVEEAYVNMNNNFGIAKGPKECSFYELKPIEVEMKLSLKVVESKPKSRAK